MVRGDLPLLETALHKVMIDLKLGLKVWKIHNSQQVFYTSKHIVCPMFLYTQAKALCLLLDGKNPAMVYFQRLF